MLNAFLDFYRAALTERAHGLTHEQMQMTHPPATLTLSRLIAHMVYVEQLWFRDRWAGDGYTAPWDSLDFDSDFDAEMAHGQTLTTEELLAEYDKAIVDSRARVAAVESLDELSALPNREGVHWDMRWILVHMIEEYARHCGHADLIRESIDGNTLS